MEVLPDVVKVGTEADAQQGEERLEGPSPLGHAGLKPDSVPRWCRPRGGGLRAQGELGHARSAPHLGKERKLEEKIPGRGTGLLLENRSHGRWKRARRVPPVVQRVLELVGRIGLRGTAAGRIVGLKSKIC